MTPALWGMLTALGWGCGDFIARFTSRGIGHVSALFGALTVGGIILAAWAWGAGIVIDFDPSGVWLLVFAGVGIMGATLLLYQGLAIGPVAVVSPIVASYPVFIVLIAVALGTRPSAPEWLAMAVVMGGVFLVARYAGNIEEADEGRPERFRFAILIALGASMLFAIAITAGQFATAVYGEFQTVLLTRWVAIASMVPFFFLPRQRPRVPMRWWPLIILQGIMDGGAYLALFNGHTGTGGIVTAVVASGFTGVTVILARIVIRESITALQWLGIALVVSGVAALTWLGD